MKIGNAPYPAMFPFRANQKRAAAGDASGAKNQPADAKQTVREMMLRRMAEIRAARTDQGEGNPRVQILIAKFKSGRKLAPDEMAYLRRHAPGMIDWIERISREREALEQGMRMAPTKTDVQKVVLHAMKPISGRLSAEEEVVRVRHLADARIEYMKTLEYRDKPDAP